MNDDEGPFDEQPFEPGRTAPRWDADEIDVARLLFHHPELGEAVTPILARTAPADPVLAALHGAAEAGGSKRALVERLVAASVAPADARTLARLTCDPELLDHPDRAPVIAQAVAMRRAEAAILAAGAAGDFTALAQAFEAREVLRGTALGEDIFPFQARAIPDPKSIAPRRWLYGRAYLRETVSALVAPGGVGKSILAIVEALVIATGLRLLHDEAIKPRRVLYWNLEEGIAEIERRFAAVAAVFKIPPEAYAGRLFFESGLEHPLKVTSADHNGFTLNTATLARLKRTLLAHEIDVLIVDPVVSAHGVPENDNTAIDAVIKALAALAVGTKVAIALVHHARKSGSGAGGRGRTLDADDVRGAAAFVDACRIVRLVQRMTAEEAVKLNIKDQDRWCYLRLLDGKVNYAPPTAHTKWLTLEGVALQNGDEDNPFGGDEGDPDDNPDAYRQARGDEDE